MRSISRHDALALSASGILTTGEDAELVQRCGGLEAVVRLSDERLLKRHGLGPKRLARLRKAARIEVDRHLERLERLGIRALVFGSDEYPPALGHIKDPPPIVLYLRGASGALLQDSVAVVGTRRPTAAGERFARNLAHDLSTLGLPVVSGLALGIDGAAHWGCLEGGAPSVAVLAHGLHTVQPGSHRRLAERILSDGGALVSEYPPGFPASRHTFVPRNRIIAGLAQATVVVEGGPESGAGYTAFKAQEYGRLVFAVPGRPCDEQSALPNRLLRERGAEVCRDAADLLASFRFESVPGLQRALEVRAEVLRQKGLKALERLGEGARDLIGLLGEEPVHVDALSQRSGRAVSEVLSLLLQMEMEGLVEQLPGMRYQANFRP